MPRAEGDQVVDRLDDDRIELAGPALQVKAVADIFQHHPERGHAAAPQPGEMAIHGRKVAAVEQALQLRPGQRIVLADDQERLALFGFEVAPRRAEPNPGQASGGIVAIPAKTPRAGSVPMIGWGSTLFPPRSR